MRNKNRRDILCFGSASLAFPVLAGPVVGGTPAEGETTGNTKDAAGTISSDDTGAIAVGAPTKIQYLEIVSPEVDAICKTYEQMHGLKFGDPDPNLGFARTAKLPSGGFVAVRAPLRVTEEPVVRPYFLVDDIDASVSKAVELGAKIALPPMELAGHGKCAIFLQGGIEHALWQL